MALTQIYGPSRPMPHPSEISPSMMANNLIIKPYFLKGYTLKFAWIHPRKLTCQHCHLKMDPCKRQFLYSYWKPSFLGSMLVFRGVYLQILSRPDTTLRAQLSSAKAVADAPGAPKLSKMIGGLVGDTHAIAASNDVGVNIPRINHLLSYVQGFVWAHVGVSGLEIRP